MTEPRCSIGTEEYSCLQRCFITGEYCSKQCYIHQERKRLHDAHEINAFVVMNFSNMSDVVYKWRLIPLIESLKDHFYLDTHKNRLVCAVDPKEKNDYAAVKTINIVRADSDYVSSFVICNRVCQQMQIADLVVVDVSIKNANVFYELGLAIAMGKMILPVCYSDSYFQREFPETLTANQTAGKIEAEEYERIIWGEDFPTDTDDMRKQIEEQKRKEGYDSEQFIAKMKNHIGFFPWRKRLFEYYGIKYKKPNAESRTGYSSYGIAVHDRYGFDDCRYSRFPHDSIYKNDKKIGQFIYDRLMKTYNSSTYVDNTVVLYTLNEFLNRDQAAQCVINYHKYVVEQMRKQHCFSGDRVGTLILSNHIPERDRDEDIKRKLGYNIGELVQIGVNQATYSTYRRSVKPTDFLRDQGEAYRYTEIRDFLKNYTANRGMIIYPYDPVYVIRAKKEVQKPIFELDSYMERTNGMEKHFCQFHMMLQNLRYVKSVVVDISHNAIESLFWLGMAHGSDVSAIAVRHEETESEREDRIGMKEKQDRMLFDVMGLWSADLHSDRMNEFYQQLEMVVQNIEEQIGLVVTGVNQFEDEAAHFLHDLPQDIEDAAISEKQETSVNKRSKESYQKETRKLLENYYCNLLWRTLLKGDRLCIYVEGNDATQHLESISAITNYLARHSPVADYNIQVRKNDRVVMNSLVLCDQSFGKRELVFRCENGRFIVEIPEEVDGKSLVNTLVVKDSCEELTQMQEEARKQYMDALSGKIKKERHLSASEDEAIQELVTDIINYAICLYLSTVLYRYFLPFVTEEDIENICNGAEYFLKTLRISNEFTQTIQKKLDGNRMNIGEPISVLTNDGVSRVVGIVKKMLQQFAKEVSVPINEKIIATEGVRVD